MKFHCYRHQASALTSISSRSTNFLQRFCKGPVLKLERNVFFEMLFSTSFMMIPMILDTQIRQDQEHMHVMKKYEVLLDAAIGRTTFTQLKWCMKVATTVGGLNHHFIQGR